MDIIDIVKNCIAEGDVIRLPKIELSREEYLAVKKAFENYGGKWKGGKIYGFVFSSNNAAEVANAIINGSSVNRKKDFQFYATPDWVADMMAEDLNIQPWERVLEPSAGTGSLVNAVHRVCSDIEVDCYELNDINRKTLQSLPCTNIIGYDFTQCVGIEEYDVIIANPPFSKNQDITHLMKMYDSLKVGGRIACLTSTHWTFANDSESRQFREWVADKCTHLQELPSGTFKESGTDIATVYLMIKK